MTKGDRPLNEWTVLADHVAPYGNSTGYRSTFNAAIGEARVLTRRDLDTGELGIDKTPTLWAGTVIYLILLEQIGNSLRPLGSRDIKYERPLEAALRFFGPKSVTLRQRRVLYALRCAFAHEFGLFNKSRKPAYQHVFRLEDTPGGPLISWPRKKWMGDYGSAGESHSTTVNLITVGDISEEVIRKVRECSNRAILRSRFPAEELQKRYGFVIHS